MPTVEDIKDTDLQRLIGNAHQLLRSGKPTEVVRACATAYLQLLTQNPDIVKQGLQAVRPALMWPRLGANLSLKSLAEGKPEIVFERERFSMSEAITYYEFTLESAVKNGI